MSSSAASTTTLTPAEANKFDRQGLLTVLVSLFGVPQAAPKRHPMYLALKNDGILHFYDDFVHMTAANIDALMYKKVGAPVPLEMNFKMQLRALLAFYRHTSHKNCGSINILKSTAQEFKVFRNSKCNPTQEIVPWGLIVSKNEGLSNWNKTVKPVKPAPVKPVKLVSDRIKTCSDYIKEGIVAPPVEEAEHPKCR